MLASSPSSHIQNVFLGLDMDTSGGYCTTTVMETCTVITINVSLAPVQTSDIYLENDCGLKQVKETHETNTFLNTF